MEITRTYRWDMGHRLKNHDGLCRNPHGHSYTAEVTVAGPLKKSGAQAGMVMDFASLDRAIARVIADEWDHAFMLQAGDPLGGAFVQAMRDTGQSFRLVLVPAPPTAETIATLLAEELWLRRKINVVKVVVWETPRSSATWTRGRK